MSKKLWVFGCSFTCYASYKGEPIWIEPNDGVYEISHEEAQKHWVWVLPKLLYNSRNIHYELRHHGQGGLGRQGILQQVLFFLQHFQPGDIVTIGITTRNRLDLITQYDKSKQTIISKPFWWKDAEDALGLQNYPLSDWRNIGTKQERRAIAEYYLQLHDPDTGSSNIVDNTDEFVKDALYCLAAVLRKLSIEVYIWDYTLWASDINGNELLDVSSSFHGLASSKTLNTYFESIEYWSKDITTRNGHWSPNGNYKAAHFFNWCIQNGYETFDKSYLKQFDKTYNDNTYIPFEKDRIIYKG